MIGYTYGGSGENFNIPNFSDGKFMRSVGGNAAALGVAQADTVKSHNHSWFFGGQKNSATGAGSTASAGNTRPPNGANEIPTTFEGGVETRPYNMSVVVLIKAKEVKEPATNQIDKSIYATEAKAGIAKLKNSVTGKAEDAAVTEKAASEIKGQILGVGQSLQNMTGQRQANKNYENTTGRPIALQFSNAVTVEVGGQSVTSNFFIIPPNTTYKAATMPTAWFELR